MKQDCDKYKTKAKKCVEKCEFLENLNEVHVVLILNNKNFSDINVLANSQLFNYVIILVTFSYKTT